MFVFYFRGLFRHTGQVLFFADALSVALFALAGANKAFACEEGFVMVVILGALTSVGGGALRDISVGETPGVFQRSNFYAVAGFGGAFVFAAMAFMKAPLCAGGGSLRVHCGVFCVTCRCTTIGDLRRRPTSRRRWPVARERPSTSAPSCFAAPPCIARRSPLPAPRGFAIERISVCNRAFSSCTPGAPSA
ncbi:MAG: trimeric intracellular cation channel family protein [Adlercreutzia equolifaciens]